MTSSDLKQIYFSDERISRIASALNFPPLGELKGARIFLKGICGSAASLIANAVAGKTKFPHLIICSDKEEAAYFFNDLEEINEKRNSTKNTKYEFTNEKKEQQFFFFPSSFRVPHQPEKTDNANVLHRAEVLNRLLTPNSELSTIIVTYPEAISEKVITKKNLAKNTLSLKVGEKVSIDFIIEVLFEFHFERVEFVTSPGQFSVRGGIVDIFSFANDFPYRIEFSGDAAESIRSFSSATQLSIRTLESISIIPNVNILKEEKESFLEFLPKETVLWLKDFAFAAEKIEKSAHPHPLPLGGEKKVILTETSQSPIGREGLVPTGLWGEGLGDFFISKETFAKQILNFSIVEFGAKKTPREFPPQKCGAGLEINFNQSPQPSFAKNFALLNENLLQNQKTGFKNIIAASNAKQIERLYSIFEDISGKKVIGEQFSVIGKKENENTPHTDYRLPITDYQLPTPTLFTPILLPLHEGFIDKDNKIACYTDHQIFERYHRFHLKDGYQKAQQIISLKELTGLQKGDYVTHIDHGIGVFDGLETIDAGGKQQEAIRLRYKDGDILYVSIHSLHRIAKYSGKEGAVPKINKLGTGAWQALKQKTKKKIKELAFDLVKLYAKRKAQKGFQFLPDTYLQNELEASFIYEDTPDQLKSTNDVKKDMEEPHPMDRLICGDVGFGKTEIAIRAAFKAVTDGKQVAVLAPTTILTLQHYKTFSERLKNFPCTVDYINRFKSTRKQKETLKNLNEGKTDILIGTHRLIGKDVLFKDLGLLIIDEEQKFGVGAKEKLRTLKENVDTLTLTATPIPRTLQFSLMGARDLSVINTPPPNRYPVQTEVHTFNEETIRDAVTYELSRSGQVFCVHNKIKNIQEVAGMIQRLVPDARIAVAHGQMEGHQLEEVMLRFIEEDYDVLVCTAIIESGLDIANANTIVINDAQNFGLSDLHQLRGRVGRSNKKAFCYLLTPPFVNISDDARKRMNAIEKFSDLGSGFNIALRDLDIRGAGNMLGAEQSGFITEIGYEMYQKILNEAMEELREECPSPPLPVSEGEKSSSPSGRSGGACEIETDFEIMLPSEYVNNMNERIALYKELSEIETEEKLLQFEKNLIDRFGEIPQQALDLLNTIRLRWLASETGFEKLVLKNGKMVGYILTPKEFQTLSVLDSIIQFAKENPNRCRLKEKENKLSLIVEGILNIDAAVNLLREVSLISSPAP